MRACCRKRNVSTKRELVKPTAHAADFGRAWACDSGEVVFNIFVVVVVVAAAYAALLDDVLVRSQSVIERSG